ncbi:MAG TPA: hypothetical protein ENH75_01020 [archaeon]|nr:hypothetical protein [archaeon]
MTDFSEFRKKDLKATNFLFENLEDKGRLQYFFHSPSSELPIRDVLDEQKKGHKTEPHIEIGAENYINKCYQPNNIVPYLKSKGKYLFLFTTCKVKGHKYFNKKCIVGYISKKEYLIILEKNCTESHYAVLGDTYLFSFNNSLPISLLGYKEGIRIKKVEKNETRTILNHFRDKSNIVRDCVKEIKRLDKKNITCKKEEFGCKFKNQCLRWKIPN